MKKWTDEELDFLLEELKNGSTHEAIGIHLGRTKSSVMHKVQRLGIAKKAKNWQHLSDQDMLDLVVKYKTAEEFDSNPELPGYKTILKRFKLDSWNSARELAGIPTSKGTRYDHSKLTTFYIIRFVDIDGQPFFKYGVTQRPLKTRYSSRVFDILYSEQMSLEEALKKENEISKLVNHYKPIDQKFYKEGHGGYTECFLDYIKEPEWLILVRKGKSERS